MKKIVSFLLAAAMCVSFAAPVFAASGSFPHAFWSMADNFANAQAAGDDKGIIAAGTSICELLENSPKNADTIGVLGTRYQDIANAYERLGDFESASEYFKKYIPYGEELGWTDGVRIAKAKSEYYQPALDMYLQTDSCPVYFGAKNEPKSGVLFGQVSEHYKSRESMILLYEEFGTELSG